MCRCGVSGWNATVIDPFPIDAGRCRKTGHLCLQGGFIWSEGWWINQSQTILWNWEEQLRKNRHFVETNWIPAPINTNLMFFMQKKTSSWDYIMLIPLNHFPNLKKKTKKQNKQKTPQPKPNPFFKTPKNHRKSLGFFCLKGPLGAWKGFGRRRLGLSVALVTQGSATSILALDTCLVEVLEIMLLLLLLLVVVVVVAFWKE